MNKDLIDTFMYGDAKEIAGLIDDESIDLVFTDPVYDRIDDYEWLAKTALRILRPGKSLLVWCGSIQQYEVQPIMAQYLRFVMPLTYTKIAKAQRIFGYRVFHWTTPLLWFVKPSDHGTIKDHKAHDWLVDTVLDFDKQRTYIDSNAVISAQPPPKDSYKWHKNPEAYKVWLEKLSDPGGIVYDPFGGSGSLPILCIQLGRHFIASEIDYAVYTQAQQRIANTQAPNQLFFEQDSF